MFSSFSCFLIAFKWFLNYHVYVTFHLVKFCLNFQDLRHRISLVLAWIRWFSPLFCFLSFSFQMTHVSLCCKDSVIRLGCYLVFNMRSSINLPTIIVSGIKSCPTKFLLMLTPRSTALFLLLNLNIICTINVNDLQSKRSVRLM